MELKTLYTNRSIFRQYILTGIVIACIYAVIEYYVKVGTRDAQLFIPLIVRAILAGGMITTCVAVFEIYSQDFFKQRRFIFLVLVRSLLYTLIITFWLSLINSIWQSFYRGLTLAEGISEYLTDESYLVNLSSIFLFLIVLLGLRQINSLHKKGELAKFIMGKYHHPREVERIFSFIDLKNSTTIAEQLGHFRFASFLKDYYSDITEAIRNSDAEIYQYVGDEIVLSWSFNRGLKNNNMIHSFFMMKDIMQELKPKYLSKYGIYPDFKAGIHGGKAIVTWVGEVKKEIVYLGDVLNTTARIQECCKRLNKDFLISKQLLDQIKDLGQIKATFAEEIVPRGKEEKVQLFSLEYQ